MTSDVHNVGFDFVAWGEYKYPPAASKVDATDRNPGRSVSQPRGEGGLPSIGFD